VLRALRKLSQYVPEGVLLSAQPNAGWPERRAGRIMYPATPEYFGEYALAFVEAGARLVGGCCGTTPAHIRQMRSVLDDPVRHSTILTGLPGDDVDRIAPVPALETTGLARRLQQGELVVTVEISPPKGYSAEKTLAAVQLLKTAGANTINVADSPRARMRMSPWALCHLIQDQVGLETLLHFPTRGRNILRIQGDLLAAHALNVRNIFAVMGDPTTIGDYPDALNDYDVVPTGLITLLKQKFNQGIDQGGESLAQPTNFVVGCAVNLTPDDPDREMKVLRRKIESGADFALTQPVYDVSRATDFVARYESRYGPWTLPVIAGVLPLYSGRHAEFLHNEVPGIEISADLQSRMYHASDQAAQEGVKIALEIIGQFRQFVQGIYLIPAFGRYDLVAEIIEQVS
jgi:homocysteine S-methyltransferase